MEERLSTGSSHRIAFNRRKQGSITGVREVISFDSQEVILDTEDGRLTIRGSELHVNRLTVEKGEVDLEGQVDSLVHSAGNVGRESLLSRLFG